MDVPSICRDSDLLSIDTLVLEEQVQKDRAKEISELQSLSEKVGFVHSNFLYYRNPRTQTGKTCYQLWETLLKEVGGTRDGWWELGNSLGIARNDLNYIMHSCTAEDQVDIVLQVFRQKENATMDKIVDALIRLKRYDILKSLEDPLCKLAGAVKKPDDSGFQSGDSNKKNIVTIELPCHLPAPLNKKMVTQNNDPNRPRPLLRPPASSTSKPTPNERPILFLTYAQDGFPTSLNIQLYVENWEDLPDVEVITLNNRRDELYQNPEKFIREYFEKADIIIPIITSGYLAEIKSHNPTVPNTSDNLDHRYVNFIYNLIVNHYIHATGCLNKKVRSVLPKNANVDLFRSINLYPDLMPWTYEANFDEQFKAFLGVATN